MICPKCRLDTLTEEKDVVICSHCGFKATLQEYNVWKNVNETTLRSEGLRLYEKLRAMFKSTLKTTPSETGKSTGKGFACPKCGKTMQKGYLVSSGNILWSNNPLEQFGFKLVEPRSLFYQQAFGLEAYRCRACRVVYIEDFRDLTTLI